MRKRQDPWPLETVFTDLDRTGLYRPTWLCNWGSRINTYPTKRSDWIIAYDLIRRLGGPWNFNKTEMPNSTR